jgi:uncharacterized protein YxjI
MKLYLKQKVFSIGDKYNIFDADGNVVFSVKGQVFSFAPKFFMYDEFDNELFMIQKKLMSFMGKYEIYEQGLLSAVVTRELTFFSPKLNVEGRNGSYSVSGDVFSWSFEIENGGRNSAHISKKLLSWGDSYEISVYNDDEAPFICALVIALDNLFHNENR